MPTSGEAEAYHREASALIAVISPPTMKQIHHSLGAAAVVVRDTSAGRRIYKFR